MAKRVSPQEERTFARKIKDFTILGNQDPKNSRNWPQLLIFRSQIRQFVKYITCSTVLLQCYRVTRQVTLCDLIWHVISRSGVVISITNCYIRFTFTFTLSHSYRARQNLPPPLPVTCTPLTDHHQSWYGWVRRRPLLRCQF